LPLRLAVLTCGTIVTNGHLPAFSALGRETVDVVAFTSRSRSSAERAAAQWGSGAVVDDWRDVVGREDVDAVLVCSPNALHAEMSVAASEAGKHVLVEKPIAVSLAEADAMVDAATSAGVVLMAAHNLRFAAPYAAAAAAVRDGRIGAVVVGVRVAFGHAGPQAWATDAGWFRDRSLSGGGALIDLGIHVADLLRAVTGDEVDEVSALVHRPAPDAVEEAGQVIFTLRGGGVGSLHASWMARPGPDHQLVVHGTEGSVTIERGQAVVRPADGSPKQVVDAPAGLGLHASFLGACRGEAAPAVTGLDGRAALAIIDAAYRSAAEGRQVAVAHR